MHKSSLSHCIYAMIGLDVGYIKGAYNHFMRTLFVDLKNLHRNTKEGIHAAAVGGTWQTVVFGFCGLKIKGNMLAFYPKLPKKWKTIAYQIWWRKTKIFIEITHNDITLRTQAKSTKMMIVEVYGKKYSFAMNQVQKIYFRK